MKDHLQAANHLGHTLMAHIRDKIMKIMGSSIELRKLHSNTRDNKYYNFYGTNQWRLPIMLMEFIDIINKELKPGTKIDFVDLGAGIGNIMYLMEFLILPNIGSINGIEYHNILIKNKMCKNDIIQKDLTRIRKSTLANYNVFFYWAPFTDTQLFKEKVFSKIPKDSYIISIAGAYPFNTTNKKEYKDKLEIILGDDPKTYHEYLGVYLMKKLI